MTTRVIPAGAFLNYNIRMSELRRRLQLPLVSSSSSSSSNSSSHSGSPPPDQTPSAPQLRVVRRNLFGPIDHEESLKFVQEELTKIAEADSKRWNFDFKTGTPLEGRYAWEPAKEGTIPVAYDMPNLTSRLTQPCSVPTTSKSTTSVVTTLHLPQSTVVSTKGDSTTCDDPLQSVLRAVTTASTTVITSVTKSEGPVTQGAVVSAPSDEPTKRPTAATPEEKSDRKILTKQVVGELNQTLITDFLKTRKRPRSPPEADGKGSSPSSPPFLKRTRTSST